MRPRLLTFLIPFAVLLLPIFAHAQGDDWTFNAPPLSDGIYPYDDAVLLVTGWAPPNEIAAPSYAESVGWDEVDGVTSFDVILAEVDGLLTTIYATHGLYVDMADFEYHFSSVPGLVVDDIDPILMYQFALNPSGTGLDYEADGTGLYDADFRQVGLFEWPSIVFDGPDAAYNPNYRYWELGYTPVTYDSEEYKLSWFVPDLSAGSLYFGRPFTTDLDGLDPDLDLHIALVDLCQEDVCAEPGAEHFRTTIFWADGVFSDVEDLEDALDLSLPSSFDDYTIDFFSTDVVLEAPSAFDDFTFIDWPTGVTGSDAYLDWLGNEVDIHVFDADTQADIENVDWCWLMNSHSGDPIDPYIAPQEISDGIYQFLLPELPLRPGDTDDEFATACYEYGYLMSYIHQLVATSNTPLEFPLMPSGVFTDLLTEELEYTGLEEDTGFVFGFAFWEGPYGWEPVGCAEASATGVDPDDIHYTDSTVGMPTLTRTDTDPADSSFLMVNVPVTTSGMTMTVETENGEAELLIPAVFESALTFSFILFDGESNPTDCE